MAQGNDGAGGEVQLKHLDPFASYSLHEDDGALDQLQISKLFLLLIFFVTSNLSAINKSKV